MMQLAQECTASEMIPGAAVINGVVLPQRVLEELRRLGTALSWYSAGELEDAVEACAVDGQLIDDPMGMNFRDRLSLSEAEKAKRENIADTATAA